MFACLGKYFLINSLEGKIQYCCNCCASNIQLFIMQVMILNIKHIIIFFDFSA